MKKCGFAAIGISVAAFIAPTHPASAENLQIVWRVVDQFRLLQNDVDVSSVLQQIRTAPSRAAGGRTDSFPSPLALRSYDLNTPAIPSTRWDAVTQQYHARYAHPSTWEIQVSVRGAQASAVCNWSTTETVEPKSGSCTNVRLPVKLLDEVRVSIVATPRNDSIVLSLPTKIEHRRIVVMGDSFASGEGVPEINRQPPDSDSNSRETTGDPYWWDQKCHRSLLSAGVQSALKWSSLAPWRSTTVLSYACSGAEIGSVETPIANDHGGILSPYVGRETQNQLKSRKTGFSKAYGSNSHNVNIQYSAVEPLDSQINQAIRDLCSGNLDKSFAVWKCDGEIAHPDLIILSVGGNDVGFGEIIRRSVKGTCDANCIDEIIKPGFAVLPLRYEEMANTFRDALKPRRVLMLDYGDPTRDQDGNFCKHDGSPLRASRSIGIPLLTVTVDEYRLAAQKVVEPLNALGRQLALSRKNEGWAHLNVMAKATNRKGICSKASWFTSSYTAVMKQNRLPQAEYSSGTAHPNVIYHSYQADAIVDWMQRTGF